ncbi:MAG: hypothetical protein ACO23N_08050, partial [Opitutales bacterium]
MGDDPTERLFWWFFRPFLGKRAEPVPEGVSDEELIRKGDEAARRPWNLLISCLLWALLPWGLVELHALSGLAAVRRPDDIHFSTTTPWVGAVFIAMGLTLILFITPLRFVFGYDAEGDRVYRLAFEAKHKVNVRHALALLGVLALAMGTLFLVAADDFVAFDRTALRWRHLYTEHSRPIADIAEVRWYRRKETPRGGPRRWEAACIVFKDGTRLLTTDGFMRLGMTP